MDWFEAAADFVLNNPIKGFGEAVWDIMNGIYNISANLISMLALLPVFMGDMVRFFIVVVGNIWLVLVVMEIFILVVSSSRGVNGMLESVFRYNVGIFQSIFWFFRQTVGLSARVLSSLNPVSK